MSNSQHPMAAYSAIRGPESARLIIDGIPFLNFVGSCYLAQQMHPTLMNAGRNALETAGAWYQIRTAAYSGCDPIFDDVADAAARFFGTEAAVYMPSGYFAGPAAVSGLAGQFDVVVLDELAHFSLVDAARQSLLPTYVFPHLNADRLAELLKSHGVAGHRPLLMTDGVFATSGSIPPLAAYDRLVKEHGGQLFVDESHAYGVLGEHGRGASEHCGVFALHGGSISKGICAHGGIFPCTQAFADRIKSRPPLRGVGAGSPISAAVSAAALNLAQARPERRQHLRNISQRLKTGLRGLGLKVADTVAPITSFQAGLRADMQNLQRALFSHGINVVISNYIGSGPEGVIRCATFADHTESDIDQLIAAIRELI